MILHWDGSSPLLMIVLIVIYFFIYKKENKTNKILNKKAEESSNNADDFSRLYKLVLSGEKVIKKSDFKYLTDDDFATFDWRGVKFI